MSDDRTALTDEMLARLRKLLAEATPQPWRRDPSQISGPGAGHDVVTADWEDDTDLPVLRISEPDSALIVAAINALPDLLAAAERPREVETVSTPVLGYLDRLERSDPDPVLQQRIDRMRDRQWRERAEVAERDLAEARAPEAMARAAASLAAVSGWSPSAATAAMLKVSGVLGELVEARAALARVEALADEFVFHGVQGWPLERLRAALAGAAEAGGDRG